MENTKKITILGDVMCEPPLFAQVSAGGGKYDFLPVFAPLKKLLSEADYVIANLETPLAGEEAGYTASMVSFNTPDAIAETLKEIGVDMVSTANNHCTDRGMEGLVRTVKTLDRIGLAHTGTYADPDATDRIGYFTVGDTKLALLAYTTSNNGKVQLTERDEKQVNMLRPSHGNKATKPKPKVLTDVKAFIEETFGRKLEWYETVKLTRALGLPIAYADSALEPEKWEKYLAHLDEEVQEAKKNADVVLYMPHTGGQFNVEPGCASQYFLYRAAQMGVDAILAAHSHTTQKAEYYCGVPCFYSLGNVTMWPHSAYSERDTLPEYGLAAHLYTAGGRIVRTAYSIFKMDQDEGKPLRVVPVDELYDELTDPAEKAQLRAEVAAIVARVGGKEPEDQTILREYVL